MLWLVVALLPNNFTDSLEQHSSALRNTTTVELWTLWAIVTIALWILHPLSLTVARCVAPVIAVHLIVGIGDADTVAWAIASGICAVLASLVIFNSEYGNLHVQAGAYGDEKRFLLRVPVSLFVPVGLAYLLLVAAVMFTPLLIADRLWVFGGIGLVLSVGLLVKLAPRLYQLAKRWLVFVPAGIVIHDPTMLSEVLMLRHGEVVSIALAPANSQAIDLTGFTRGIPLEVQLREMIDVRLTPFAARILKTTDALHVQAFLTAPTRPEQVLRR